MPAQRALSQSWSLFLATRTGTAQASWSSTIWTRSNDNVHTMYRFGRRIHRSSTLRSRRIRLSPPHASQRDAGFSPSHLTRLRGIYYTDQGHQPVCRLAAPAPSRLARLRGTRSDKRSSGRVRYAPRPSPDPTVPAAPPVVYQLDAQPDHRARWSNLQSCQFEDCSGRIPCQRASWLGGDIESPPPSAVPAQDDSSRAVVFMPPLSGRLLT